MSLPEENNSCFFNSNELCTFINNPTNKNEFMLHPTLEFINRILLEEDIDEQFSGYQEAASLSDIEKPFYDILGEKYLPLPDNQLVLSGSNSSHNSSTSILNDSIIPNSISTSSTQDSRIESLPLKEFQRGVEEGLKFLPSIHNSDIDLHDSSTSILNDSIIPNSISTSSTQDSRIESLPLKEFQRGVEEGLKFLPSIHNSDIDLHVSRLSLDTTHKVNNKSPEIKLEEEKSRGLVNKRKLKKCSTDADFDLLEGQNRKMSVSYTEETIRDEMFYKILLYHGEEHVREENLRMQEIMKREENKDLNIDLESLLIQCSEAVARNDHKIANELIKETRKQASPVGNGTQRLACILNDALEARLAGTGSETYRQLVNRRISTREILKAYHMYITASPLLRISYCYANDYICKVAENASKIHIIDLGITFGFQWPPLIQALAKRKGGAPKLRITGIDLPQRGFRPAERIKQTGVRLEEYAKNFNVPFEYQYIASLWESVCIKDLKIDGDEVLIVNSMFRFKQVRDEPLAVDCPRDRVLNLIKQIKPKVFILGIFNVSFSPFFTARFKKVISQYSMLFDMLDTLVPRDDEGRQLFERELLASSILNLVACEGCDRVERPETYKQWHKRIATAGFEPLAMDRDIVTDCNEKVKNIYHEGFFIEEESNWLLQGWKGKINYAVSVWEPILQ